MDLFTHVLTAYLVSFGLVGFQPQYLAAGAIGGGLPDADVLLFPLARRWPIFRHHGITHSITGVTVVATVGAFVGPMLAPGSALVYFAILEIAGLVHVLEDGFTHYSVPPFLPFSERPLELDADRAINFVTLAVSVVSFYLLLGVERGHVAFAVYLGTVYALMAFFGLYFAIRLAARLWIGRTLKRYGDFSVPVPTSNPFVWLLVREEKRAGQMAMRFARYVFGRGVTRGPFALTVPTEEDPGWHGPARNASEALERSYPLARRTGSVLEQTYHFGEAAPDGPERWIVTWYSLEFTAFGRAAAVRVRLAPDGSSTAKSAWYAPLWRRELT